MPIYTSSPGDSSIGMNIAWHELMNDSPLMIDPNRDVNEVCAIMLAGHQNGCVILGGGSPRTSTCRAQPTFWEVYGIPKGGNEFFIQITTDQVVWGGLSGATPSEAVSWGKVNPGVLPDTVVAYCDSTIAFPLFCEYAIGSERQASAESAGASAGCLVATLKAGRGGADKKAGKVRGPFRATVTLGTLASAFAPQADRLRRPRIYADANVPFGLVTFMRRRLMGRASVLEEPDLRRAPDPALRPRARPSPHARTLDSDFLDDRRFPPGEGSGVLVDQRPPR